MTLAWRDSAVTSGQAVQWARPWWKLPHCGWTTHPSLEVKVCLSWLGEECASAGHLHLGCPCCSNLWQWAISSPCSVQQLTAELRRPWLCPNTSGQTLLSLLDWKSTSSEAATITFKNRTWENSVWGYSSGTSGEAKKTHSYREKKETNHKTSKPEMISPCPSLGWENSKRSGKLPAVPPCPYRAVPCNLALLLSRQGELVSGNGKDGLIMINPSLTSVWI